MTMASFERTSFNPRRRKIRSALLTDRGLDEVQSTQTRNDLLCDEAGGCAQMNDWSSGWSYEAENVDMGHHIVTTFLFFHRGLLHLLSIQSLKRYDIV